MEYKVLVKVYVPEIEQSFDMYIPVNRSVGQVLKMLARAINSETVDTYPIKEELRLINKRTGQTYEQTSVIRSTDIKNGSELLII